MKKRRILARISEPEPGLSRWQIFGVVMVGLAIIAFVAGSMPSADSSADDVVAASSASASASAASDDAAESGDSDHPTQYFYSEESIATVLQGFHTYNGKPLPEVLKSVGLSITQMEITPIESFSDTNEGDLAGDMVYTLTLSGQVPANAPCRLAKASLGENALMPEFIRRGAAFPLVRPADDDAIIYWATTGACQAESAS